jgi:hypothetical protein
MPVHDNERRSCIPYPLCHISMHSHKAQTLLRRSPHRLHFFQWQHSGRTFNIWGLTAGILISIAQQVFGRNADFDVKSPEQPDYKALGFDGNEVVVRTD